MANNDTPYELVADVITAWYAAEATAAPVVDANPSGSWTKIGTSGPLNYGPAGVTKEHPQEVKFWKSLGATAGIKALRTGEAWSAAWMLHDMTLEQLAIVLNHNSVTTVNASSGVAGYKRIQHYRGFVVQKKALLLRGVSANGDYVGQSWVPTVVITSSPKLVHSPEEPVGIDLKFEGLYHATYALGYTEMQTAAAL